MRPGGDLETESTLPEGPAARLASASFHRIEQVLYIALGVVLSLTALLALAGATRLLLRGVADWTETQSVFEIMDRLLFVLMLVEILYTVRASIRTGGLSSEPFLIVGLIACIRRILVLSLESSDVTKAESWTAAKSELFHAAMLELGVLSGMVVVMVGAIYVIRRHRL